MALEKTAPQQAEPYFISIKRAAQILQVSERTLHKYIHDGCGPPVRYFGNGTKRTVRIRFNEFMNWASARSSRKESTNV